MPNAKTPIEIVVPARKDIAGWKAKTATFYVDDVQSVRLQCDSGLYEETVVTFFDGSMLGFCGADPYDRVRRAMRKLQKAIGPEPRAFPAEVR